MAILFSRPGNYRGDLATAADLPLQARELVQEFSAARARWTEKRAEKQQALDAACDASAQPL